MKRIAIVQSNYIPWKGYFDLIGLVDEFVVLDTVQFTKNDWRNRNRIPSANGGVWLTIPCRTAGRQGQRIDETEVEAARWAQKHWSTLAQSYARAPHMKVYGDKIAALYGEATGELLLSRINLIFIRGICDILDISTPLVMADRVDLEDKTGRVVKICEARGATHYLSGPAAKSYADLAQFRASGITAEFIDYSGYPAYGQLREPFDPFVSVLDLIFMQGRNARSFMKIGAA